MIQYCTYIVEYKSRDGTIPIFCTKNIEDKDMNDIKNLYRLFLYCYEYM